MRNLHETLQRGNVEAKTMTAIILACLEDIPAAGLTSLWFGAGRLILMLSRNRKLK